MLFQKIVCFTGVWATVHVILRNKISRVLNQEKFNEIQHLQTLISPKLCHTIITNTNFKKSETNNFKCICINCFNNLRFVADISKKIQKRDNFWQLKDHNSGRRHENKTNDPIFFICFSRSNCFWNSIFYLKIVKIHFHGIPPLAHSGLQNTWILEVKAVRLGFCPVWFRNYTHSGK